MPVCTQCGALIHDDDVESHKCKEEDKAKKGETKRMK